MARDWSKRQVLAGSLIGAAAVACADWLIGLEISLGVLYIVPVVIASTRIEPRSIVLLALTCAALRGTFSHHPPSGLEAALGFALAVAAYAGAGLYVRELVRNREAALAHVAELRRQQSLRKRAEEQLRLMAESSPAAIFTLDERGIFLAANHAAHEMLGLDSGQRLEGRSIAPHLPVLADALRMAPGKSGFRTTAQCQGYRLGGEPFVAQIWFSTYNSQQGERLAAIAVDASEETREREETNLSHLQQNNRIVAAAVSHELRNLCAAIRPVLARWRATGQDAPSAPESRALGELLSGLEQIAHIELQRKSTTPLPVVSLRDVLDRLRIVVDPAWQDEGGSVSWEYSEHLPAVFGDPNGILQACLNLCQNSLEAVLARDDRRLSVRAAVVMGSAQILIEDSGPGIQDTSHLFEPFQRGATRVGLGLYISRALVRNYGGELRHVPTATGCLFVVDLKTAAASAEAVA